MPQNGQKYHIGEKLHQTTRKGKPKPSTKQSYPQQGNEDDLLEDFPRRDQDKEDREILVALPWRQRDPQKYQESRCPDQRTTEERAKVRDHGEQDEERTSRAQTDQRQHQKKLRQEDPEHEEEPRRGTQLPPEY